MFVALEGFEHGACLIVPKLDGLIRRASRYGLPTRMVGHIIHTPCVAFKRMSEFTLLEVPQLDRTVLARTCHI